MAKNEALPQRAIDQRLAIYKACPQYDVEKHRCKLVRLLQWAEPEKVAQ